MIQPPSIPELEPTDLHRFQHVREAVKVIVRALFADTPLPELYPDAQFLVTTSHGRVVGLDISDRFHFDKSQTEADAAKRGER